MQPLHPELRRSRVSPGIPDTVMQIRGIPAHRLPWKPNSIKTKSVLSYLLLVVICGADGSQEHDPANISDQCSWVQKVQLQKARDCSSERL